MSDRHDKRPEALGGAEGNMRKRHLRRAGAAAGLAVALVLGLATWNDTGEEAGAPSASPPQDAAPDEAPVPSAPELQSPAATPEAAAPEASEPPHTPSASGDGGETAAPATASGPGAPQPASSPVSEPAPATPPAVAEQAKTPVVAPPAVPPGKGYTVQPRAFGPEDRAERLRTELAALGYPGYAQSRVMLGPFPDRKSAEGAFAKLRAARRIEGVVSTAGGGHVVQLGVFSTAENAERLRSELAADGYPVLVHGRVIVGPFPDRKSAEAARAKLKNAGMLDGAVVPPPR